jgi:acetolactate synthase-1/2/3 large subunit
MIKVSDYIAQRLADWGVRHLFMVTGGGAMHLNDSFGKESRIRYVCMHHEQAAAMAAEGYARITNTPGVINVTTGPGGINALNGVFGAYTDSIPMLIVSGQVKRETCKTLMGCTELRQLGDQEADIVGMVKGITKYAVLIDDPKTIRYHLEKAFHLAKSGRPGPCWIDVPVDVQGAMVNPDEMRRFEPQEDEPARLQGSRLSDSVSNVISLLKKAKRPVIMVGSGVRLAGAVGTLRAVAEKLGIPVTTAWTAHDTMPSDHPLFCGRPSTIGDRAGNFTVQNADLLLVIGCKLSVRQVSYSWKYFARHAYKVMVDIDPAEMSKTTVRPDLPVVADAKDFLLEMQCQLEQANSPNRDHPVWLDWCRQRLSRYDLRKAYPEVSNGQLNPYWFFNFLFQQLVSEDAVVCGDGSACVMSFQVATIPDGLRLWTNGGSASMGYDLPAAIGAAVAKNGKRTICLAGDGSMHMNIQELQTVKEQNLNLKVFVINNGGYLSMRMTQSSFFGRLVGESPVSGVSFPDYVAVAKAYGLKSFRIDATNYRVALRDALEEEGPVVCEVFVDPKQQFEPKLSSRALGDGRMVSSPLEDLSPFLDREELAENMLVPMVEEP